MIHNAQYVIAAYSISLGLIAVYAISLAIRHSKIKKQTGEINQ
ncbi:MAG: hypothetical protein QNL04_12230 [SAR324 cluster bacterium]|nr:hypothetical protein [SAR324 cluster bacterium]